MNKDDDPAVEITHDTHGENYGLGEFYLEIQHK